MRYKDFAYKQADAQLNVFNVATLFVPRGQVDAFIATCDQHNGRIVQTRVLTIFGGFSVDVLTQSPETAASLLGDWVHRSRTITDTVRSGKSLLNTLSDLVDGEGAQ